MPRRAGQRVCRYEYDHWIGPDGCLYVKATGLEYERASEVNFQIGLARRLRALLTRDGLIGEDQTVHDTYGLVEWDRSHNIADGLLETMTYRTVLPAYRAPVLA